jgi:hypothetical protein
MSVRGALLLAAIVVFATGCQGSDGGSDSSGETSPPGIGDDDVARYQLEFTGDLAMTHTGGLICKVEDGSLIMDFSIDASDGVYEYGVVASGFDPEDSDFDATFDLTESGESAATGTVQVTFGYGPAPDDIPGVVRAAGTISGPLTAAGGDARIDGSYACLLQNAAVGA